MSEPLTKEYLKRALDVQAQRLTLLLGAMMAGFAVVAFIALRH